MSAATAWSDTPVIHSITRAPGIAGQFSVTVELEYYGEGRSSVTFVGSVYSGPVVMVLPSGAQTYVSGPEDYGDFSANGPAWVRSFFAPELDSPHVDYPHEPGRLYDCDACAEACHCDPDPGTTACVFDGPHNYGKTEDS
jgi:hypothetical protein